MTMQLQLFEEQTPPPPARRYRKRLKMTCWVVIEDESRDFKKCVWGVGKDIAEAVAESVRSMVDYQGRGNKLHDGPDIEAVDDLRVALRDGYYRLCRCTTALARDVGTYGGEIDFNITPDGACTPDEFYGRGRNERN